MKRTLLPIVATVLAGGSFALGQETTGHSCHGDGSKGDSGHHAKVDERGDHVMGFDHAKTTHHFLLSPSGGSIEVTVNDPADEESRAAIRTHLAHVARMFAEGNFDAPIVIHDRIPPGVPTMKRMKSVIEWKFEELPSGGAVRITTKNADARAAIHEFLRFQIEDHETGDSPDVTR